MICPCQKASVVTMKDGVCLDCLRKERDDALLQVGELQKRNDILQNLVLSQEKEMTARLRRINEAVAACRLALPIIREAACYAERDAVLDAVYDIVTKAEKPHDGPRKWSVCSCTEGMGVAVLCPVHGADKRNHESVREAAERLGMKTEPRKCSCGAIGYGDHHPGCELSQ